jgi:hypothetical protein
MQRDDQQVGINAPVLPALHLMPCLCVCSVTRSREEREVTQKPSDCLVSMEHENVVIVANTFLIDRQLKYRN